MRRWLINLPIQRKLIGIILLTLWSGLLLAFAALISYDYQQSKQSLQQELLVLSQVIGERSQVALAFADQRAAKQNVASLKFRRSIVRACMYDQRQQLFAIFDRNQKAGCQAKLTPATAVSGVRRLDEYLVVSLAINKHERQLGHLLIYSSLDEIYTKALNFAVWALIIQLLAGVAAYLLTRRLQAYITEPIVGLSRLAGEVATANNYQLRAVKKSSDEVGLLVQNFNQMLHKIELADADRAAMICELELSNDEQQVATHAAQTKTQAIREFFSGVSHDIKQPLNALSLFANELQQQDLDRQQQLQLLAQLDGCISNVNGLFSELLDIDKLETKLQEASLSATDIPKVLGSLQDEFKVLADDKNLSLRVFIAKPVLALQGFTQADMLSRLIRNLTSNAIRYTHQGGVLISCRLHQTKLLLQVWDTGIGMDTQQQQHIFKPYQQLGDDAVSRQGHGLGLAIVQRISKALGHKLELSSRQGKGSVFSLWIDVAGDTQALTPAPVLAPAPLLVFNLAADKFSRKLNERLSGWGFEVCLAESQDDLDCWFDDGASYHSVLILIDSESAWFSDDLHARLLSYFAAKSIDCMLLFENGDLQLACQARLVDSGFEALIKASFNAQQDIAKIRPTLMYWQRP